MTLRAKNPSLIAFGAPTAILPPLFGRLIAVLLPLGVIAALVNLMFASAQVMWAQTNYLALPATKIFLVFGGVFGPLDDYSEPARSLLLMLPPSDLFFQPAHYCVKGHFYGMSAGMWSA